jgi:DNA-binding CsgD family transcriptional regulator
MTDGISAADLPRLQTALGVCAAPLLYPSVEAWGRAVVAAGTALLGAEQAVIGLPVDHTMWNIWLDASGEAAGRAYVEYYWQLDTAVQVRRPELGAEVYGWESLYSSAEMAHDELVNDWCRPHRLLHTLGMGFDVGTGGPIPALVHFYRDREAAPSFGARGATLLSLLLPAFKAGVHAVRQLDARRADLLTMFDRLTDALLLYDEIARLQHINVAAQRLLAGETAAEQQRLQSVAARIARRVGMLVPNGRPSFGSNIVAGDLTRLKVEVRTVSGRAYTLAGSLLGGAALNAAPLVVVTMTLLTPTPLTDEQLRGQFALTPREMTVARLLARGFRSAQIAAALGISRHTARRHTEAVLRKLSVSSRGLVAAMLTDTRCT